VTGKDLVEVTAVDVFESLGDHGVTGA